MLCGNRTIDAQLAQIAEHIVRVRSIAERQFEPPALRRKLLELVSFSLRHALDEETELEKAGLDASECRKTHDELTFVVAGHMLRLMAGEMRTAAREIASAIERHIALETSTFKAAFALIPKSLTIGTTDGPRGMERAAGST